MLNSYKLILAFHVMAGLIGLLAFWTPALARKGGATHVRAGRVFFWCTCAIAATGMLMAALLLGAPLTVHPLRRAVSAERAAIIAREIRLTAPFLFYLVLITFAPVYHGVRVLATRRAPDQLRTPFHTAVHVATIVASVGMLVLGLSTGRFVYAALSPIGFLIGFGDLGFARKPYPSPMAWWYEHMNSMLGGGVAFHTAFFVLGMRAPVRHLDGRPLGRRAMAPPDDRRRPGQRDLDGGTTGASSGRIVGSPRRRCRRRRS